MTNLGPAQKTNIFEFCMVSLDQLHKTQSPNLFRFVSFLFEFVFLWVSLSLSLLPGPHHRDVIYTILRDPSGGREGTRSQRDGHRLLTPGKMETVSPCLSVRETVGGSTPEPRERRTYVGLTLDLLFLLRRSVSRPEVVSPVVHKILVLLPVVPTSIHPSHSRL